MALGRQMVAKWAGVLSELRVVGMYVIAIAPSRTQKAKHSVAQYTRGSESQLLANHFNPRHVPLLSMCVSISTLGDQTLFEMRKL